MSRTASAVLLLALSGAGCGADSADPARGSIAVAPLPGDNAVLQAELLVIRDVLRGYVGHAVVIDSTFSVAEQAPGTSGSELRPSERTAALRVSLAPQRGTRPPVVLHLSRPRVVGTVARITVTVDFPDGREPNGWGYETVEYTLDARGSEWRIRTRVQLGIT